MNNKTNPVCPYCGSTMKIEDTYYYVTYIMCYSCPICHSTSPMAKSYNEVEAREAAYRYATMRFEKPL